MRYDFVFTFTIVDDLPFSGLRENVYYYMMNNNLKGYLVETLKGLRVLIIGSSRRKVERFMNEFNGRHLRILDDLTFNILNDFVDFDSICGVLSTNKR